MAKPLCSERAFCALQMMANVNKWLSRPPETLKGRKIHQDTVFLVKNTLKTPFA